MKKFEQKKMTELEKKLANRIQLLKKEIINLPAYKRKKKDEEIRENFQTITVLILLGGMIFFGAGWLVVAAAPTLLTLSIVESGLFLSIAIGFSAWPVSSAYLWTRDLFSSEKIKNQNKEYDQLSKRWDTLQVLQQRKKALTDKINLKLNRAIECLPSFTERNPNFQQLNLEDQIHALEQERKNHPVYPRKQKDQYIWHDIHEYSVVTAAIGLCFYSLALCVVNAQVAFYAFVASFPGAFIPLGILALVIVGPYVLGRLGYATYLEMRDLFSSAEIKTENKQYAQLEKTIAELTKLDAQDKQLNEKIANKLEASMNNNIVSENIVNFYPEAIQAEKNAGIYSGKYSGKFFEESFPDNQNSSIQHSNATQPRLHLNS